MTIRQLTVAALLASLAGMLSAEPLAVALDRLEPCALAGPGGHDSVEARCGTLKTSENPDEPLGRRIELRYALVPARSGPPRPDAVVYLAGGPGQAATEVWPFIHPALYGLNHTRHILLLDQRGSGGSHRLDCQFGERDRLARFDEHALSQLLRECLAQIDADPRFYTTSEAVDDLEALRAHLGFERLNLIGGSYGTRKAQLYLRRYPERVRSLVLDGVVPMSLKLGSEHGPALDRALAAILADCTGDPACSERFPELEASLAMLRERYRDAAETVIVEDPRTGESQEIEFGPSTLALAIRFLTYAPQTQALLPYLIHDAARTASPKRLASQALMVVDDIEGQMARGMELSVLCSEDYPHYPEGLDHGSTLLGNAMLDYARTACRIWPARPVAPEFHEPVAADVPALLLSGERDPVTPPSYGEQVARQLPNSRHVVLTGQGHIVIRPGCIGSAVETFIEQANVEALDLDCIERMGPEPFFLDLLGPAP